MMHMKKATHLRPPSKRAAESRMELICAWMFLGPKIKNKSKDEQEWKGTQISGTVSCVTI